jgi:DNA-binding MarR family transcriptional regulator
VIDRLEKKGWINRVVSERDRRSRELSLSPEGEAIYAALKPVVKDLQADILVSLSAPEREQFLNLARRVLQQ